MYRDPYIGFPPHLVQPTSYDRSSTKGQVEHSADRQNNTNMGYAEKRGWKVPIAFSDPAVSGRVKVRRGLDALWQYLAQHENSPLIVDDISRLARSDIVFAYAIEKLHKTGAVVYDWEGYVSPVKLMKEAANAIEEHQTLMRRTQDGHDVAGAKGKLMSAPPYGYRRGRKGVLVEYPAESSVVKNIFEQLAARKSSTKIADDLNLAGKPAPRGGKWWPGTVLSISRNTVYAGYVIHRRRSYFWDVRMVDGE